MEFQGALRSEGIISYRLGEYEKAFHDFSPAQQMKKRIARRILPGSPPAPDSRHAPTTGCSVP